MENKILDLLEKVYIELQDTKKELKQDISGIDKRLTKLEIKIEHDISQKIDALFEARDITNVRLDKIDGRLDKMDGRFDKVDERLDKMDARFDKVDDRLDRMENKIDKISDKVAVHDTKIHVIQGGKKKKSL